MNTHSRDYQLELLDLYKEKFPYHHLSVEISHAFLEMPRHKFLQKFSVDYTNWIFLNENNLTENLPVIYADHTLLLYAHQEYVSTISQPTLVLLMLQMLDLHPGMKVFEIGAGSGWNAALMGSLVGHHGKVISYEIIEEMSLRAKQAVERMKLPQVEIHHGDAFKALGELEMVERAIFTAGSYDLPPLFFDKLPIGGKLLFVLKTDNMDLLLLLERQEECFIELDRLHCQFVTVTGKFAPGPEHGLSEILSHGKVRIYPKNANESYPYQQAFEGETCRYVV